MTSPAAPRIKLLVVDDHTLFRRGLTALLSQDERLTVIGEAADVGEALRSAERLRPDLILLDNHLPGVRGVDGLASLKAAVPGARVLMLTVSENESDLAAALKAGADGYLLKTVESDQLCDAIVKVLDGESVVSPELMGKLFNMVRKPSEGEVAQPATGCKSHPGMDKLSAREREILALIVRGDSNKVIARELDIAETTVKIHVQHILRKLNLSSRVQAAVYAAGSGMG